MKELTGKTITKVLVNEDQSILSFVTDYGVISYETYADCCSETWFADITGVKSLLDATVISAENVELDVIDDGRTRQEFDSFYGVKLTTNKGYVDIVYRNSSNGYYGGDMWLKQTPVWLDMTEIADDWSA